MAKLQDDEATARLAGIYLARRDGPSLRLKAIGVYEKLDKAAGFRFLRSMCQLLQRSGLAKGTVLLFDEARRSLSLMANKAQKVACENLLSIINHCNSGSFPGTLFLYGVMPDFLANFAPRYAALQQRCGPATRINLETLKGLRENELLFDIGQKITALYEPPFERDSRWQSNAGRESRPGDNDGRRHKAAVGQELVEAPSRQPRRGARRNVG